MVSARRRPTVSVSLFRVAILILILLTATMTAVRTVAPPVAAPSPAAAMAALGQRLVGIKQFRDRGSGLAGSFLVARRQVVNRPVDNLRQHFGVQLRNIDRRVLQIPQRLQYRA